MNPSPETHPAYMNLYPVMETVVQAIQYIESQVPIMTRNEVFSLLMTYHNTLIKEIHTSPCQLVILPTWRNPKEH